MTTTSETRWTRETVEALGPTLEVPQVAAVMGVSAWNVYQQIRQDTWQLTRVLRIGRSIKIPTRDLVDLLFAAAPAGTSA